jgi:hypothetical protein
VTIDEVDRVGVTAGGGPEAALRDDAGGSGVDHGEGDPVPVGIDADDVLDEFCKHE